MFEKHEKRECDIKEMLFDDPEKAEISDSWDNILFSVKDGTYKTKYSIGNYKLLALKSGEICYMQIAAFDTDILAYDSGKAAITWISIEPLDEPHRINSKAKKSFFNKLYEENTGAVGGWEKSEMRTYMNDVIKNIIPDNVKNSIKTVSKFSSSIDIHGDFINDVETFDDVWIPSFYEIEENGGLTETKGCNYHNYFSDISRQIIKLEKMHNWFTRSACNAVCYYGFGNGGIYGTLSDVLISSQSKCGIVLGFCT